MSLSRPTLANLVEQTATDLESRLDGADAHLLRSNLRVLAAVQGAGFHSLYGWLQWITNQAFPQTADLDGVKSWASFWGLTPKAAAPSTGSVEIAGLAGTVLDAGTQWTRTDAVTYSSLVTSEVGIDGTVSVEVLADTVGTITNAAAATALSLVIPIADVDSAAVVGPDGLSGGTADESRDELLTRLLQRVANAPQGGAQSDYERWATECAGVTRAWVYPGYLGLGTVAVFILDDDAADPIPPPETVETVQAYIDDPLRRPVTAAVTVFAPVAYPVNFQVAVSPVSLTVKDAVVAELAELLKLEGAPGSLLRLSHVRAAVSAATGEIDNVVSLPAADVQMPPGSYPVMGDVTWG